MREIPYSLILQWYQEEYSQQQTESVYGPPKDHLLKFFDILGTYPQLKTVLDLGCGDGANAIALARRGYDVTGIDFAGEEAVLYRSQQESLNNVKFVTADITDYPFEQKSYDCVICAGVCHLLSDQNIKHVAHKAKRSVNTGGLIYLDVVANMQRVFQDSGEPFVFTGLGNWSAQNTQDFFTDLFSDWILLEWFLFHQEADWPVKAGHYPIDPYHWSADYVCVVAQKPPV